MIRPSPPELQAFLRRLANIWKERSDEHGWKPGTKTHAKMQLEFFIGAFAAAETVGIDFPSTALMLIAVGRDSHEMWGTRNDEASPD